MYSERKFVKTRGVAHYTGDQVNLSGREIWEKGEINRTETKMREAIYLTLSFGVWLERNRSKKFQIHFWPIPFLRSAQRLLARQSPK